MNVIRKTLGVKAYKLHYKSAESVVMKIIELLT